MVIGVISAILMFSLIPITTNKTSVPTIAKTALQTPSPTATVTPPPEAIEPYVSPDGQWMALVNQTTGSLALNGPRQSHSIFPDGSGVRAVTWSPNSQRLLVVRPYASVAPRQATEPSPAQPIEIWRVQVEPDNVSQPIRLFQSSREAFERDGVQQVVFGQWSPNRRYVIIWVGVLSASVLADGLPVFILDTETGTTYPLALDSSLNHPVQSPTRDNTALTNPRYQSWSPDGSKLAITAGGYRSAQINKWLNLVDVTIGQVRTVISQAEQIPGIVAWSPQGDLIAYAAIPAEQSGPEWADWMVFNNPAIATRRIYLLDPMTGQHRRLNGLATYQDAPVWSADGARLYYVQRNGDHLHLMVADPATGRATPVPDAREPIDVNDPMRPTVGYYGQFGREELLDKIPEAESHRQDMLRQTTADTLDFAAVYTDPHLGFTLRYPSDWRIDPMPGAFVAVWPADDLTATQQLRIVQGSGDLTPEGILASIRQGSWGQYLSTVGNISLDDQPAFLVTMKPIPAEINSPQFLALVVALNGEDGPRPLIISGSEVEQPLFEAFLEHIHLLHPDELNHPPHCSDTYPGLPDTLRVIPNSGEAQVAIGQGSDSPEQRLTLLDVMTGKTRIVEQTLPLAPAGWSPSGQHLLLGYPPPSGPGHIVSTATNPFWAPPNALPGATDWLAWPTSDRGLLAVPFPGGSTCQILPPDEMPASGLVLWSNDGWLARTSDMDASPPGETFSQTIFLRPVGAKTDAVTWPLSDDIHQTYYRLIDWVPGTRLILAAKGFLSTDVWSWGLSLVTINADNGEIIDLGAVMPLSDEAYAWQPTRPGQLAFIESGSRSRTDNSRLALLDVTSGERRYLTPATLTAFEPTWSPDGRLLAYAAAPLTPNAKGDGPTLERLLNGRAIYLIDPDSGQTRQVTQPGDAALDGWPHWTADGTGLLYARRRAGQVEIRIVSLKTWQDEGVVEGVAGPDWCHYGGCGWGRWLAYNVFRR